MRILLFAIAIATPLVTHGQSYPSKEWQIATATLAAPEQDREGATVLGYESNGELAVIRQGTNDLICLADDPSRKGFSAACYHKSLEPFMARGRVLKKEGKSTEEIFNIREAEAKAGTLEMPERALLSVLTGQINESTQKVEQTHLRWVFYIPFATAESTGLPLAPVGPGAPWIMNPGTHRAHIMITPPKEN